MNSVEHQFDKILPIRVIARFAKLVLWVNAGSDKLSRLKSMCQSVALSNLVSSSRKDRVYLLLPSPLIACTDTQAGHK